MSNSKTKLIIFSICIIALVVCVLFFTPRAYGYNVDQEQIQTIATTKENNSEEFINYMNKNEIEIEAPTTSAADALSQTVNSTVTEGAIADAEIIEDKQEEIETARQEVVDRAYSKLGCNYVWGGTTSAGFDCSGFVYYCLTGEEGVRQGTTADLINLEQTETPHIGDICVVHNSYHQHTGIYIGNNRMIHACCSSLGIIESDVYTDMIFVKNPYIEE